jgi:hypothetical protein
MNRSRPTPALRPRNPLVAAARFRRAGAHDDSRKRERQAGQLALRTALAEAGTARPLKDT